MKKFLALILLALCSPATAGQFTPSMMLKSSASCSNTWSPSVHDTGITLSGANLVATGSGSNKYVGAVNRLPAGAKTYFELTLTTVGSNNESLGLADETRSLNASQQLGISGVHVEAGYRSSDGAFTSLNSSPGTGSTYTTGDVIGVAYDDSTGNLWWAKNNVWQRSGDPATAANPIFTLSAGTYYPAGTIGTSGVVTANFGASAFVYTPPSGFTGCS